jgi:hypothetical protein
MAHALVDVEPQLTRILAALLTGLRATTTPTHPSAKE